MLTQFFIFDRDNILLEKKESGEYSIPISLDIDVNIKPSNNVIDVTKLKDGTAVKAIDASIELNDSSKYELCTLRNSFYKLAYDNYIMAGKCHELLFWDKTTKYCGICGSRMEMTSTISKRCTGCGHQIWPQLAPAVIVLIQRGKEILLVHAKNFKTDFYGLVSGFVETGETLEHAVHREVMEETGLTIGNLHYFGSQPWPYPSGIMVGFMADYKAGELKLQEDELSYGGWFTKENLPKLPENLSIARQIINFWLKQQIQIS